MLEDQEMIAVAQGIIDTEIQGLEKLKKSMGRELIEAAKTIYESRGKLIITGIGKTGAIGRKIAATLSSTGTTTIFMNSTEGLHGDLGMVNPEDIVIGISNSGESDEILHIIPAIKNIGAKVFAMTGNPNSRLAQEAEIVLFCGVESEGCPLNLAPMASTTSALALGDALAGVLMRMRNFQPQNFAMYHPGGSLGRRLLSRVKNLMKTGEDLALCSPDTKMKDVILKMNEKRLGILCVMEKEKLVGIITEGDIRRALSREEEFFTFCAEEIMTKKYKKVEQDMLANEALSYMEEGKYQISVMPVFHEERFVGVVRIHDLLKLK
ncbi:KpsF/GutQ family sugar-phosphate isomerase [Fusobacterium necrophorum]|uniref:KpsF/GutQ family sugar-phosphate isomerase n=1 Tax=Fusobacterium necrophorum TaxID=859 RepID=A0A4Q2KZZ6_9FUSO|nr:KpsF/GutQ family sugar-phosphate isomerase [Fusobacterium necrophorum]RXZ69512.1 KpsF/GutQ family sugar-phosphate isomerase [Fusobacterium necrophorum]